MSDTPIAQDTDAPRVDKIVAALAAAQADARTVPKDGKNSFNNYRYPSSAAVNAEARRILSAHAIVARVLVTANELATPGATTQTGKEKQIARVTVELELLHESGQSLRFGPFVGFGTDTEEKATAKAHTVALKTALIQTLLLDAGDDPEDDSREEPKEPRRDQRREEPKEPRRDQRREEPTPKAQHQKEPEPKEAPKETTPDERRRGQVATEIAARAMELLGSPDAAKAAWPKIAPCVSTALAESWERAIMECPELAKAKAALAFKPDALAAFEQRAIARCAKRTNRAAADLGESLGDADSIDDEIADDEIADYEIAD